MLEAAETASYLTRERIGGRANYCWTQFSIDEILAVLAECVVTERDLYQAVAESNIVLDMGYAAYRAQWGHTPLIDTEELPSEYRALLEALRTDTSWPYFDSGSSGKETYPVRKWQRQARQMRRRTNQIRAGIAAVGRVAVAS